MRYASRFQSLPNRREFLRYAALGGLGAVALAGWPRRRSAHAASKGTVELADIGVGDPGGDWSKFTEETGWDVNLVAIGNAPISHP